MESRTLSSTYFLIKTFTMQQFFTLLLTLFLSTGLIGQTTADFENFDLEPESFLNGSDGSGGFSSGNIFLNNTYTSTPDFSFWSGWSISNTTDQTTPGVTNQYSAYTGTGSSMGNYAVTSGGQGIIELTDEAVGGTVEGMMVTNTTYAALSMLEGDDFAKKFGGETGDDPDFFLLTIKKWLDGNLSTDSVDFYLADYRFDDNSMDYIVDEFTYIDLSSLGNADSLQINLSSSDVGQFGMNTPAYFAMDNFTTSNVVSVFDPVINLSFDLYPNPTTDYLVLDWNVDEDALVQVYNMQGQLVKQQALQNGTNSLNVSQLPVGYYTTKVQTATGFGSALFYKN